MFNARTVAPILVGAFTPSSMGNAGLAIEQIKEAPPGVLRATPKQEENQQDGDGDAQQPQQDPSDLALAGFLTIQCQSHVNLLTRGRATCVPVRLFELLQKILLHPDGELAAF
jgi:hypothetical protein